MPELSDVYITGVGSASPGAPLSFEEAERVLGPLDGAPQKTRAWVERVRPIFKELLGIRTYYYALDPATRRPIDDNVTMSVRSGRAALAEARFEAAEIDLVLFAGMIMENICPPTTVLLQEELGIPRCAEFAIHSNCTSIYKAIQVASDFLRLGRYRNALVVSSQLSSPVLRSEFFNQALVDKKQALLRWFLCDGAGALVLTSEPRTSRRLRIVETFIEATGLGMGPEMTCVMGGHRCLLPEAFERGWHHLSQDFESVAKVAPRMFWEALDRMLDRTGIDVGRVRHFLANIPTRHLSDLLLEKIENDGRFRDVAIYSKLAERGYPGPPAILIALDEFVRETRLRPGELILSLVTESSKWMHGGFILEAAGDPGAWPR
jgi:3-oxoacyl-[acyl-carrier-protein] synthase III